jgi:ABC-type sugar transport system substrate-binding protein
MTLRLVAISVVSASAVASAAGVAVGGVAFAPARATLAPPAPVHIGVILKGFDNPYFVAMFEGARAEASRLGARLSTQAATSIADAAGQAARARTLVPGGDACYIANPVNRSNLIAPLRGVTRPIVNVDSVIDPTAARRAGLEIATYIGTDNVAAGALAARGMRSLLPRGGDIALVGGLAADLSSVERLAGFARGARGTGLRIVARVAADFDRRKARLAATQLLRDRPTLDGFFAANDIMALGIADAIRALPAAATVKIIGVDGIPDALDAIRLGSISGTVAQYAYAMGQMAVDACVAAARGAHVPTRVDAPVSLITSANVGQAAATFPQPPRGFDNPLARLVRPHSP